MLVRPMAMKSEFDLIATYFAPLAKAEPGSFGLTDDAAVLPVSEGMDLVSTADCLVSGVHFLPHDPPETIALKLLAVNISDLASMGAVPRFFMLAAAFPQGIEESWIAAFADGLRAGQKKFGGCLVGGDTVSTDGPLTLTLTALGEVPKGQALRRSGANPGDLLYLSGTIGDAFLGLQVLQGKHAELQEDQRAALIERYRTPTPKTELGVALKGLASACIDISDGLAADLKHLCEMSSTGAEMEVEKIPLSPEARSLVSKGRVEIQHLLSGGDDYELLFSVPKEKQVQLEMLAVSIGCPVFNIGVVKETAEIIFKDGGEVVEFDRSGYRHF